MTFFTTYAKEIFSLLVPLLTWVLNTRLKAKAKLAWWTRHSFTFLIQEPRLDAAGNQISPSQLVRTASVIVSNKGKETSKNVEIVFNWKPQYLNIWPVRDYVEKNAPGDRYVMIFDSLSPNEDVAIELLSVNLELPDLLTVRCDQCVGDRIETISYPVVAKWKINVIRSLALVGFAGVIYIVILGLQFLLLKTPLAF